VPKAVSEKLLSLVERERLAIVGSGSDGAAVS
jgi:hypothetical protein